MKDRQCYNQQKETFFFEEFSMLELTLARKFWFLLSYRDFSGLSSLISCTFTPCAFVEADAYWCNTCIPDLKTLTSWPLSVPTGNLSSILWSNTHSNEEFTRPEIVPEMYIENWINKVNPVI